MHGTDRKIIGHFRPNRFIINPQSILPVMQLNAGNAANHEASSILILPDGRGDSSDVNTNIAGLDHP